MVVFVDSVICVSSVQNKLQALAEQHVDVLESLAPVVRKRVDVLIEIQVKTELLRLERASRW